PNRRFVAPALALVCLALFVPTAWAQDKEPQKIASIEGITEYRLPNGVRYLLFPDKSANTVTVNMTVLVGSRHEGYGETGMAHLLEHMVFKGTPSIPNGMKALQEMGADFNGTTWVDRTNYYETMPASDANLEFGIKLEADRLVNSFILREDLAKEMTVVRNEFEAGENNPDYILNQRMMAAAYEWHNYGKSTIGNRSDIERVPIERLQAFYKKHYQPDNIILAVAGKFDEKKALNYISRYFGSLKRPERKLDKTYTDEPAQDGERIVILRRVGKVPVVGMMYHIPAAAHADMAPLDVLGEILTDAPSGRLYKALVDTKKATRISGGPSAWHDPSIFEVTAQVADGVTPEEVRDIMVKVMEDFTKNSATKEEVDRAKQKLKADFERALTKSKGIAIALSEWAGAGDWRLMFIHRDRVGLVTGADVDAVASKYLKQNNRTVGMFLPTSKPARSDIPKTPSVINLVKDYKGGKGLAQGEVFDPTPANIEKRVKRTELPSGIKVAVLAKKTRGEAVVGQLTLRFGNEKSLVDYTTADKFLGSLMMRGTKKHSRQQIEDMLNKLEAKLNASSSTGQLTFSWQAKRATLPGVLDLLGEILREPAFPGKEFDILKGQTKQSLEKGLTDPQALAMRAIMRKLAPYLKDDIRYQPTIEESLERLAKTNVDQVERLYKEQVGAQVGQLVFVGDLDADAAVKQVQGFLNGWKTKVPFKRITKTANTKVPGSKQDILTPDKENAVYVAGETFQMTDTAPEYPALVLGNFMLGGSATSRLFDRLRQKEGLSYGAGSFAQVDSQDPFGMFMMFAICNPENMQKADKVALEVFGKTLKDGVSDKELEEAQKAYLQEQKVARANDSLLAGQLREGLYLGRTFEFQADLEKKIATLSAPDVNQTLARFLSIGRLVIIRAGDFNKK
ncbi:MAG TPA: pitrilysin family protein, partial [Gemmataceae bacterium]|nr:pitrilysin family protein [Gemmataceae bacterium]